jgi:hypothetical protein
MKPFLIILLFPPLLSFAQKQDTTTRISIDTSVVVSDKISKTFDTIFNGKYTRILIERDNIPRKIRQYISKHRFENSGTYGFKAIGAGNEIYYIMVAPWKGTCCGEAYLCFDSHFNFIKRHSGTYFCDTCF